MPIQNPDMAVRIIQVKNRQESSAVTVDIWLFRFQSCKGTFPQVLLLCLLTCLQLFGTDRAYLPNMAVGSMSIRTPEDCNDLQYNFKRGFRFMNRHGCQW